MIVSYLSNYFDLNYYIATTVQCQPFYKVVDELASSSGEVPPLYLLVPLATLSLSALG